MAVQTTEEFKAGGSTTYSTAIEKLKDSDLKVRINGNLQTYVTSNPSTGEYTVTNNPTQIVLGAAAPSGAGVVHIYRETNVNTAAAVFQSGSSIRAKDLNDIHDMARFAAVEHRNKIITADIREGQITSTEIKDDTIVDADINSGAAIANTKLATGLLPSGITVNSDNIVNGSIVDADINASADIEGSKLKNDSIPLTKFGSGTLPSDIVVTRDNIENGTIQDADIETGTLDNRYFTETELDPNAGAGANVLDARYYTEAEADARFYNLASAEEIQSGETWVAADNKVATTAAIDARIIDLVDDVGGFVPIANETVFPDTNPDVNNGVGTLISIKELSTTLTPSSGSVTISNGNVSNNANITITGCGSTVLAAGFGAIVETTSTLHTYTFHRLTPKATEVTTVSGISTDVTTVAGIASDVTTVAGKATEVTAVAGNASNINAVAGNTTNINAVAGNAANINAVKNNETNINTVAGSISNVNTVSGSIASVNNASANISSINNFGDQYQVASSNPSTDGGGNALAVGDLFFNTTANELKIYNGTAWQAGVTATGNFALTTGNSFSGDNVYADNAKARFGTGQDLSIYHDGSNSIIEETGTGGLTVKADPNITFQQAGTNDNLLKLIGSGGVELYHDNVKKLETLNWGVSVTGHLTASNITANGAFKLGNGNYIIFGASNGMFMYHTGTTGYIDNNVGTLKILSDSIKFRNDAESADYIECTNGGSVDLYFNNVKKFETASTGINVSGNIFLADDNGGDTLRRLVVGSGNDLIIYHNGTNSYITEQGTGSLHIQSSGTKFQNADGSEDLAIFLPNGGCQLFHNDFKAFETTSGGARIIDDDNTTALHFSNAVGDGGKVFANSTTEIGFKDVNNDWLLKCIKDGAVELYHDNVKKFETSSAGAQLNGHLQLVGHLDMDDGHQIKLGTDDDFKIHHDGTHNFLETTGADIVVYGSGEDLAKFKDDGAVELYFDGSLKFETNTNGCLLGDDTRLQLGGQQDLEIYHNGTTNNSYAANSTGIFYVMSDDLRLTSKTGAENYLTAVKDGGVELFHDNVGRITTTSTGLSTNGSILNNNMIQVQRAGTANMRIGSTDASGVFLYLDGDSNGDFSGGDYSYIGHHSDGDLRLFANNPTQTGVLKVNVGGGSAGVVDTAAVMTGGGSVDLYYDNSLSFQTASWGVDVINDTADALLRVNCTHADAGGDSILRLQVAHSDADGYIQFGDPEDANVGQIIYAHSTNAIRYYCNASEEFRMEADGDFHADGDVIAASTTISSDERLKENIEIVSNPIEKVEALRGVTFDWKRDGKKSAGVIAQDVEKVLPQAVKETKGLHDPEPYKTVNYNALISILIESVKELSTRVKELEAA